MLNNCSILARILPFAIAVFLFQSCGVPIQKLVNFQEESVSEFLSSQYVQDVQKIKIQSDDILAITVAAFDSSVAKVFNQRPVSPSLDGSFIGQGYLVDEDGYIEFPILGKIPVKGLSREVAKDTIKNRLLEYLRDPVVEVRFLNMHISVIGEVKKPGLYTFPDERFSVLEALSLAGDMTDFADRENVLIIREIDKVREFGKVDLSSSRAFESPYFYLAQNDVVYIKPIEEKAKIINDPFPKAMTIASLLIALTSSLAVILIR